MTYTIKPSDVYPSKEAVDNVLGCKYKVSAFGIPVPGELYIASWWKTTYKEHTPSYKSNVLSIRCCREHDFVGVALIVKEVCLENDCYWE